jgi:hypothetical protein
MVDFRYHLVSLIAVFLALACGVALGAGPLRQAVGDTVSGRTATLTAQNAQLQSERDAAVADDAAATAALDAAGAGLLDGTLHGYRVAVVTLGPVDPAVVKAIDTRLGQGGATVVSHAALAGAWTDPAVRSFRQSLVGYLTGYLDPAPPAGAGADAELAQALVQGLVGADPAKPDAPRENASLLLQLLSTGDTPLVTLAAPVTTPADAVVLLAPGSSAGATSTPQPTASGDLATAGATLLQAAQAGSRGAVLAEVGPGPGPVVAAVLGSSAAGSLATVSGAGGVVGQLGVPLALAQRLGGTAGHYGAGTGLTALPPRTVAPAPARP